MAVSYVGAGTAVYSAGSPISVTPPLHVKGDLLVLVGVTKPDTATPLAPTDYVQPPNSTGTGGTGTTGLDTGPMRTSIFYKVGSGSAAAVSVPGSPGPNVWGWMFMAFRSATGLYDVAAHNGVDTVVGTAYSATMGADIGIAVGDMIATVTGIPTDLDTPANFTAEALAATGATIGLDAEVVELDSALGNNLGGVVCRFSCSAGASSAAAVFTATQVGTINNAGPTSILRIRETTEVSSLTSRPLLPMLSRFKPLWSPIWTFPEFDYGAPAPATYVKAGDLLAGTTASGTDATEHVETGSLTAGTITSGPDSFQPAETGSLTAGTTLSGDGIHEFVESGSLTAGTSLSGTDASTFVETGSITTRALASGADASTFVETGSLTTQATLSGADVFTASETGTAPVGTILSGVSVYVSGSGTTYAKTGSLTAGTKLSGPDASTFVEAGSLTTQALASGADAAVFTETGSLLVAALLSGISERMGSADPGYGGSFDPGTSYGRTGTLVADADYVVVGAGRSGARNVGGGYTSVQSGKIDSEQ